MATMANLNHGAMGVHSGDGEDPFMATPPHAHPPPLRYANFDNDKFAAQSGTSPGQARRALEAHLKETDRRIQDASRLGTNLLQQRKDLAARLKDVEQQKDDGEIGPDLQKKLSELEREYTEVGKETARAFLPKSRLAAVEANDATMSPSVFSGDSRASPSKVSAPSRRQRNQPSSRVHDIEFATEISTSLLAQVRELQAVLVEKDDALKQETSEKSRLEMDVTSMRQRLRHLDDNEQKYKDENWNLETQLQEVTASLKEAGDKEHRLTTSMKSAHAERETSLRELEDLKQTHGKLTEDHAAARRQQESDLHILRRDLAGHEHEREQLHKKIEELTGQNTELARAVAHRWNEGRDEGERDVGSGPEDPTTDRDMSEYSPPPSPTKGGRHGVLETETLKSSLQHAHRMIQNLKNNIHREKTEKLELKRMLQDTRDELENRRNGADGVAKKRRSEPDNAKFRRPLRPDQLGAARMSREEIIMDDPDWEDHDGEDPLRSSQQTSRTAKPSIPGAFTPAEESSDAFETANEKDTSTETEAFQTSIEDVGDEDSGEATETEAGLNRSGTARNRYSSMPKGRAGDRSSFMSTASMSGDDHDELHTPIQAQQPRYKLKIGPRGRRSGRQSELFDNNNNNSPAFSHTSSNRSTPIAAGQNLGDELDGLSDEEEQEIGTPSRVGFDSNHSSPQVVNRDLSGATVTGAQQPTDVRPAMIDSGMMTEPWQPESKESKSILAATAGAIGGLFTGSALSDRPEEKHGERAIASEAALVNSPNESMPGLSRDAAVHAVPTDAAVPATLPQPDHHFSGIVTQQTEPVAPRTVPAEPAVVRSLPEAEPILPSPRKDRPLSQPAMALSSIFSQNFEPSDDSETLYPPRRSSRRPEIAAAIAAADAENDRAEKALRSQSPRQTTPEKNGITPAPVPRAVAFAPPDFWPSPESSRSRRTSRSRSRDPSAEPRIYGGVKGTHSKVPTLVFGAESDSEYDPESNHAINNQGRAPLAEVPNNAAGQQRVSREGYPIEKSQARVKMSDEGSQTLVSSNDIDRMMKQTAIPSAPAGAGISTETAAGASQRPVANTSSPRRSSEPSVRADATGHTRRPSSAGSVRKPGAVPPPLPVDHSEKIAQAVQKTPFAVGSMGPPLMPASAYKANQPPQSPSMRSRTGSINAQSPSLRGSRAKAGLSIERMQSPISRRSSVSSFASEVDQRLNPSGQFMYPADVAPATDPRMIQAITQTMIGEYLWKYTRKAGRSEISTSRHRRFFWVHPYTRTLYWSEQDPSTAGKQQLKAKSVAIEAVRVITDDNAYPPGLHRKSIVVVTPGREIVFTAPTSQRHETWLNALSYLLLRTAPERETAGTTDNGSINDEDIAEFNPQMPGGNRSTSRATGRTSRASLSSYNSRTTTRQSQSSPQRRPHAHEVPSLAQRQANAAQRTQFIPPPLSPSTPAHSPSKTEGSMSARRGSMSGRLSSLSGFMSLRGRPSFSASRKSRTSTSNQAGAPANTAAAAAAAGDPSTIYDASVVNDSAEDLRAVIERQERDADRLENVRACCDGRHDVGSLSRAGTHRSGGGGGGGGSLMGRHNHSHAHTHSHPTAQPMSVSSRPRRGE